MPTLTLFCGVNGSGKTTLYQHYKANDEVKERVNTEEFKKVAELEKGTIVFYDSKTKWLDNIFDAKTQHKQKENIVR